MADEVQAALDRLIIALERARAAETQHVSQRMALGAVLVFLADTGAVSPSLFRAWVDLLDAELREKFGAATRGLDRTVNVAVPAAFLTALMERGHSSKEALKKLKGLSGKWLDENRVTDFRDDIESRPGKKISPFARRVYEEALALARADQFWK